MAFTFSQWKEILGATAPAGTDLFSETSESAALQVLIDNRQKRDFLYKVAGYSWADRVSPYRLHRVNPMPHPFWGFMFATKVGFTPFQPAGNPNATDGQPKITSVYPVSAGYPVNTTGYYAGCRAVVDYGALPYTVREDSDYGGTGFPDESARNVDWTASTTGDVSILSAETGDTLKWAETSTDGPTVGNPIQAPLGEYVNKTAFTWRWYGCASEYILDLSGIPIRFLRCLGKVNLTAFRGYPAGTLLLNGFVLERYALPWRTAPETGGTGTQPAFAYNVTFQVSHFDPTPAAASPIFRGHNLLPYSRQQGTDPNRSIWYAATRTGTSTGPRYLPGYEFTTLFKSAIDPS